MDEYLYKQIPRQGNLTQKVYRFPNGYGASVFAGNIIVLKFDDEGRWYNAFPGKHFEFDDEQRIENVLKKVMNYGDREEL